MNAATRAQLARIVRLLAFTLFSSAIVTNLANAWAVRYPLIGLVIGGLEAVYRTAAPTVAAPRVVAVPAQQAAPKDTSAGAGGP